MQSMFFFQYLVPSDVSRHAFIPPASQPRLSCRLQASRSCSRWCSPVASLENSWESLAWRARTWRLGPVFSKILKSVTPKRPCLTQSFNIYIQTHKHIYIYVYMYMYNIHIPIHWSILTLHQVSEDFCWLFWPSFQAPDFTKEHCPGAR